MADVISPAADYSSQRNRYGTYYSRNSDIAVCAICLATAGFVQPSVDGDGEQNVIQCPWCQLQLRNLHKSHHPLVWHRVLSPSCPFVKNNRHVNFKDLGISFPDSSATDLVPVVLRSVPRDGPNMEDDDFEMPSNGSQGDGHITISRVVPDSTDDRDVSPPTTSEELIQIYQSQDRLRLILPKQDIDMIRAPMKLYDSRLSTFTHETKRRSTFNNWPKRDVVSPQALAASGFIYLRDSEDTVECVYCKIHISGWTADMVPDIVHRRKSIHCQFMQGSRSVRNVPDTLADIFGDDNIGSSSNDMELGIITESSKYPEFAIETRRKATFLTWPSSNEKLASEMVEHELFYTGRGDVVCCFTCGTEMSGWSATDNVWRRHARYAPHCQLVIQEKGADWVDAVIEEHGRYVEPEREPSVPSVTTRMLRPRMDNLATQNVLQMVNPEYPREEVRSALIQNIKYGGADYMTRTAIVKPILKRRDEKRQLEAVQRSIENQPPPPEVVTPPQRPVEGENDGNIATVQLAATNMDLPSTSGAAPANASGFSADAASSMDAEPTTSHTQHGSASPSPIANPMDLARTMKAQLTCKICMDAPVGIAFLPCGHMVCCPSCAPAMIQCPLCRQDVRGTVRVYLDKL